MGDTPDFYRSASKSDWYYCDLFIELFTCRQVWTLIPLQFKKQEVGIWRVKKRFPRYGVHIWSLWPNIRFLPSIVAEKNATKNGHIQNVCSMCIKINKVGKQEVGILSWEAFLDPSDSYFLCWFLYTLNIYVHFSSHFSQQLLMAEIWYLVTSFI
jgi:hypothetical protein